MQFKSTLFVLVGVATAALSSCSRATYSFQPAVPASSVATSGASSVATPNSTAPELTATTLQASESLTESTPTRHAATALAQLASKVTPRAHGSAASASASALPQGKLTHQVRKALRQELQRQLTAPQEQAAGGKSQLVALLLLIFLGGLGIERFYLGYTGRGILYIALLLTSFLILPAIALTVLLIIDLVRTITGSLKPKNGDYAKTL